MLVSKCILPTVYIPASNPSLPRLITAWSKGMLMADNQPLADFITELSRYRSGFMQVDPAIKNLAISGSYPLNNIEQILTMLSATYLR